MFCFLTMKKTRVCREDCPMCNTRHSSNSIHIIPENGIRGCSRCRRAFFDSNLTDLEIVQVSLMHIFLKLLYFLQNYGQANVEINNTNDMLLQVAAKDLKLSLRPITFSEVRDRLIVLGNLFGQTAENSENDFFVFSPCFNKEIRGNGIMMSSSCTSRWKDFEIK